MAVGPALPWRAASGELLRNRLLIPAWVGRHHAGRRVAARHARRRAGARRSGSPRSRSRASAARSASACAPGGARTREARPGRDRAHGARQPAALRRARRAHRRRRDRGRARGVVGLRHASARCSSRRVSRRRCAATRSRTSVRRSNERAEDDRVGARPHRARGATTSACTRPAISTFPNFNTASGRRRCAPALLQDVYLTLVSSPTETGRVTLGVQINPMVLWLWIGGGIMALGTRSPCCPPAGGTRARRDPAVEPLPDEPELPSRPSWRRSRHEAPRPLDRARRRAVVVVLGVVLALNVSGSDPNVTKGRLRPVRTVRARRSRVTDARRQAGRRSPTSRARRSS